MTLAQPLQALALVRERLLHPRPAVDRALDLLGAARDRVGVREQERRVDAAGLGEQRAQRSRDRVARDPTDEARLEPGEVLDDVDPRHDARRALERDRARRGIEARELREL